jgi:hypothetical protein
VLNNDPVFWFSVLWLGGAITYAVLWVETVWRK